jgi:hypothetical protein
MAKPKAKLGFVDLTQMYYNYSTDAPEQYGWWMAVQLLGHSMGYDSIHLIQPGEVRHNLYVILIGGSTLARKSTSQRLARIVYPMSLALPKESSPEQFIVDMSEQSERMLWMGEFTKFLKNAQKGGYMSGMIELFNDFYDCPDYFERKLRAKKGQDNVFAVEKAYLSANSTVTPEMLKEYISEELVRGGFLARWILVYGTPRPRPRGHLQAQVMQFRATVDAILKHVLRWVSTQKTGITFILSNNALKRYNQIEQEAFAIGQGVEPFVGRYMDCVIKVADILLVSDAIGRLQAEFVQLDTVDSLQDALTMAEVERYKGSFVVDVKYVEEAWVRIKESIKYAQELSEFVSLELPIAKLRDCVLANYPQSHSSVMRRTHVSAKYMVDAVNTLIQQNWLIRILLQKKTKSGQIRPQQWYCMRGILGTEKCLTCDLRKECHKQNE